MNVKTPEITILMFRLCTDEYTFRISITIKEEKVIVTMLVNDSQKSKIEPSIITQPQNTDFQNHIMNVLADRERPFCSVLYNGGYFRDASSLTSWSNIRESTGRFVYIVEYPIINAPL